MFKELIEKLKDISINRLLIVFVLVCSLFFVLIVKLFNIQVIDYKNETITEENIKTEDGYHYVTMQENPARGNIYDRNGTLLAYNVLQYNLDFYNSAAFKTNDEKNAAIYALIQLLDKHGMKKEFDFPMIIDEEGNFQYTISDKALLRFLKNCYGLISVNDLSVEQKNTKPEDLFEYLKHGNSITSMFGISDSYSDADALEIISYRYQLYINNPSYKSIRLISNITDDFRIEVLENENVISCVEISKSYRRIYNDSIYFAHIIGYVGEINDTELAAYVEAENTNYNENSVVGKLGVEKSYDEYLQGTCGEIKVTLNSAGQIVKKEVVSKAIDGNDLYLTVDRDAQVAGYYLVEKNIASILLSAIVNSYDYGSIGKSADDITIPIYEVYSALVTNNVIKVSDFDSRTLTDSESRIYQSFLANKSGVIEDLKLLLAEGNLTPYNDLGMYTKDYMDFLYSSLRNKWGIITVNIDTSKDYFVNYQNGTISISSFISSCIENGNIDTSILGLENGYYDSSDIYTAIYNFIFDKIENDNDFSKQVYRTLIFNGNIEPRDLCLILFEQGVIGQDTDTYNALADYQLAPFDFIKRKINNLEITPAMLALRPCSGSIVATDPNSGDLIAMVSYPSYDNNLLTNQINYSYYSMLSDDKSYPMLCRATQSKTTTGSTIKPLSSIMALTEGIITTDTIIHDNVKFTDIVPSPACWAPYGHGDLNVTGGIENSCNYFFFTIAYNMSLTSRGEYSDEKGLKIIKDYATRFGLNDTTGVEITESEPAISNTDAVRSSIGYYHSFAPVQISRYATTIANQGTCYNLTLIDKVVTKEGSVLYTQQPTVYNTLDEVSADSWSAVRQGMYRVVNNNPDLMNFFSKTSVVVAGKTGTAQVSLNQPNNALFISYAPYDNPEICVTAVLPNGYKSSNAAKMAAEFYSYYFDGVEKENLLSGRVFAGEATEATVGD